MTRKDQAERQEAIERLRQWVSPGDTVYTILRHVSRSGMRREIGIVLIGADGVVRHPNATVATALGYRLGPRDGVIADGCGMDMGFQIVYNLGRALWPKGFAVTERCDKCQDRPGMDGIGKACKTCTGTGQKPARGRNGDMSGWDKDGGYALFQQWM